jgi:NAD(P)-dependent dehydrogenase (short-subunit alcohol dehydrogenase family)
MDSLGTSYRAVVVGATGGLGKAFLEHLRTDPNCGHVAALSRHSDPPIDITSETSVAGAGACLRERSAEWDLILDATGVLTIAGHRPEKRLSEIDPTLMAQAFAVNAIGPALLLKHLTPLLPRRRRAIFASLSARVGSIEDNRLGGWVSYRASKAALNQILRTAALELRISHRQAVVAALQPGTVATRLSAPYRSLAPEILTPEYAAGQLIEVLDGLEPAQSGEFFDYEGRRLPF